MQQLPRKAVGQPQGLRSLALRCGRVATLAAFGALRAHAQAPANDECAAAQLLSVGASCTNTAVSTLTATASPSTLASGTCSISNTPDVWYRLVLPPSGNVTVTTSALAGSSTSSAILEVYSGVCGALVFLACDRATTAGGLPDFSAVTVRNQPPGGTLYVRTRVNNTTVVTTGQYNICAQELTATATRPTLAGGVISAFPNPARHSFVLGLPPLGALRTATLEMSNSLGQVVRTQTLSQHATASRTEVSVAGLPAGLYWVRIYAGRETALTRVVIE